MHEGGVAAALIGVPSSGVVRVTCIAHPGVSPTPVTSVRPSMGEPPSGGIALAFPVTVSVMYWMAGLVGAPRESTAVMYTVGDHIA